MENNEEKTVWMKIQDKATEIKDKAVAGAKKVGEAVGKAFEESPDTFCKIAMIGGSVLFGVLSGAIDTSNSTNKKCLVTDDVTGLKYLTKHPLTNAEILELSDRMANGGETHGEALRDMGLLRKDKKRR